MRRIFFFFFSSRRRHTRSLRDWSSDVCSSDLRDVVGLICDALNHAFAADAGLASRFPSCPAASGATCRALVTYVTDRPGHDHRYAIDATKLAGELGNRCSVGFESGLRQTVRWYVEQESWWRDVTSGSYKAW